MAVFSVLEVDFDLGFCRISIPLESGGDDVIVLDPRSICSSDDATEAQLKAAIGQLVERRLYELFPPPAPRPPALLGMIGRQFEDGV
nr:hypothetical protein [uncultured Pseudomonas sp.]